MKRFFALLSLLLALIICAGTLSACDITQRDIDAAASIIDDIIDALTEETDTGTASPGTGADPTSAAPEATETAKAPETTGAPETTEAPETAKAPETSKKPETTRAPETEAPSVKIDEKGTYTSKEEVALYIYTYGKLPSNFITKKQAQSLGWSGSGSDALDNYPGTKGKCIGGDTFGNYEKLLPVKSGRTYKECDIGTLNQSSRGTKRIVFSNDGLIYYTEDHYEHFTLLYGSP